MVIIADQVLLIAFAGVWPVLHEQLNCVFYGVFLLFRTYLSSLQLMLCCVAAVKSLPVHHYSAVIFSVPFGIIGFILSYFENRIQLRGLCQCCTFQYW